MTITANANYIFETFSAARHSEKIKTTWRALKVNDDSVFFAKVGKDGQLLKPNANNMMTVSIETLNNGISLGNMYKA